MPEGCCLSFSYLAGAYHIGRIEGRHRVRFEVVRERRRIRIGAVGNGHVGFQRSDRGAAPRRDDDRRLGSIVGGVHREARRSRPWTFDEPVVGLRPPVIYPIFLEVFRYRPRGGRLAAADPYYGRHDLGESGIKGDLEVVGKVLAVGIGGIAYREQRS